MDTKDVIKKMTIIVVLLLAFLAIFYGIAELINKNQKQEKNVEEEDYEPTIDYDTILVQNIFNQSNDIYYVYAKLGTDKNISKYNAKIDEYKMKENAIRVYTIDLDSAFNKNYVKEESDFTLNPPVFKGTTILKIENKQIKEKYELDEIESSFDA